MVGADFMDEVECGSFFDQFEDFIDFPPDNECGLSSGGVGNDLSSIWPNPSDSLPCSELSVPYEDIIPLEWLSNFMEDSFSDGGMTLNKENLTVNKESSHNQFKPSSPISVLESSSSSSSSTGSCSGGMVLPISTTQHGLQRARSKRLRPATFNPRPAINLLSPTSVTENHQSVPLPVSSSESENFVESPIKKKKKKVKLSIPLGPVEMNQNPPSTVRKCMHCEITKTPQWRAGPMGPKTLCNACGVRYKSGRLFPEYRPAASPTFVPSLHSNSHKKVVEMRNKGGEKIFTSINPSKP
ncbi:GATA transcription factor 8-like [Actinidia eriantha]|uniref:GATA transcription factor 8-like n=1 Tax=Actinidia eriantha TaxID=165200 RepID=UPI0025907C8F|nr:GATA transcription factor 8-like [Actinidia eriantha]XP_057471763.1 GATA transcription factor 8-like [Actinidia eriantha]